VRRFAACVALVVASGLTIAGCDAPDQGSSAPGDPAAGTPANDPNTFRAAVDPDQAYTGKWALARNHCGDAKKVWTIEQKRMGIQPAMRFCQFTDMYVSVKPGDGPATWSTAARCIAEGKSSHDFLFFRVKDNLREMRVTFNDSNSVDLVRCPVKDSPPA
jgi:hypothetical protein